MNNCLLCQQHEADKTGSHIIPSFLMKRINGEGKRDNEIGFEIKNGIVETYFGRDIYEDKRKAKIMYFANTVKNISPLLKANMHLV